MAIYRLSMTFLLSGDGEDHAGLGDAQHGQNVAPEQSRQEGVQHSEAAGVRAAVPVAERPRVAMLHGLPAAEILGGEDDGAYTEEAQQTPCKYYHSYIRLRHKN